MKDPLMERSRCGQSSGRRAWQPIQRQTRRFGVSSGFRRRARQRVSRQREGTAAYHSTGRQLVADSLLILVPLCHYVTRVFVSSSTIRQDGHEVGFRRMSLPNYINHPNI